MRLFSHVFQCLRLSAVLLLAILPGCATRTPTASNEQITGCLGARTSDSAVAQCTAVMNAGVGDSALLAKTHFMRGTAWHSKGESGRANADFTKAISFDSEFAPAYLGRAVLRDARGDYDGAIADYAQAIRLNPRDAGAYNDRASAFSAKGEFEKAIPDLETALRLDPALHAALVNRAYVAVGEGNYPKATEHFARATRVKPPDAYHLLWHFVAQTRSGPYTEKLRVAQTELADLSARQADSSFSLQVVDFYLGRLVEPILRARAGDRDSRIRQEQTCQVDYFVGQWHLMRGDTALGTPLLQAVVRNCPANFHERWAASLELRRIAPR